MLVPLDNLPGYAHEQYVLARTYENIGCEILLTDGADVKAFSCHLLRWINAMRFES